MHHIGVLAAAEISSIFDDQRTCWRIAPATRAAFLIDAANYYQRFAEAAEKAKHSIAIASWDIHGLVQLRPYEHPEGLRDFFVRILHNNPELHVYILNWHFPFFYASDRELMPMFDAPWHIHPRLHFSWDKHHPFGASHHQKIAVIDDHLAFVGGLDFTDDRWDVPGHQLKDPTPHDLDKLAYKPFHDVMFMVEGAVAQHLGQLLRTRWSRAVGTPWPVCSERASFWPPTDDVMNDVSIAISRTEPMYHQQSQIREVERMTVAIIEAAQRYLYIENQYFTSHVVTQALARRLQNPGCPEIVVLLPQGFSGPLEKASLGVLREQMIRDLRIMDPLKRLHFYYPSRPGREPDNYIKVHSKLMIADDRIVKIGSSNLCNRSMGVDTECDLTLEQREENPDIAHLLHRLLGEHVRAKPHAVAQVISEKGSLIKAIDHFRSHPVHLVPLGTEVGFPWKLATPIAAWADPTQPYLKRWRR